jgi:hypothetical protein
MAFQQNQADNVLDSIRSPPPPPSDLTIIQEPTARPIVQRPTTNNEELIQVDTKTAENFSQKTKALLASVGSGASVNAAPDAADQIRKLAGLLTDGLITQEEFDAKKAKLLDL